MSWLALYQVKVEMADQYYTSRETASIPSDSWNNSWKLRNTEILILIIIIAIPNATSGSKRCEINYLYSYFGYLSQGTYLSRNTELIKLNCMTVTTEFQLPSNSKTTQSNNNKSSVFVQNNLKQNRLKQKFKKEDHDCDSRQNM